MAAAPSPLRDVEKLLQDMDINRLRAVIYRDVVCGPQYFMMLVAPGWANIFYGGPHLKLYCNHGPHIYYAYSTLVTIYNI